MSRMWFLTAVALVVAGGCDTPKMVPVAPPGLEFTAVTPEQTDEEPAQAIGEMRTTLANTGGTAELTKTDGPGSAATAAIPLAAPTNPGETKTTASGLKYETLKPGTGATAEPGKTAVVHYTGTLTDGTKFDSSRDRNQPYPVTIGRSSVIRGWHEGLSGMKVGEVRKLTIPPDLAYGAQGRPPVIPANATLVFEIELMEVR
jgi:FKBP-type peptidyl-prolyl cis-trans isomerase